MLRLEMDLATPKRPAEVKAALDDTRMAAIKKNDDPACHKVIADALPRADMALK